jgi:hypothetical protein
MGDMEEQESATARAWFEIVPAASLPDGRVAFPLERDGEMMWAAAEGHVSPQLIEVINRTLDYLLGCGLWRQEWGGRPTSRPSRAWFEIVPAELLPDGYSAVPLEWDGGMMWIIAEEHASQQAAAEVNQILEHILGEGLWRQEWDGHPWPPPSHLHAA